MVLPQIIAGEVIAGNRIGRRLGFPTANLALGEQAVVAGVYAVRVRLGDSTYRGIANVGNRPTITDSPERFLEVYLFDFAGDLYGLTIEVELLKYLRPEQKFDSPEALCQAIEQDRLAAEQFFQNQKNIKE
ncbi:MAG: riboflavin kinase [Rikenellaceae bacterium]|jgi:riboflavin kinase/FMN adenylyltransferase|nr:riboflavin kinase [Rikenellaceae bacterium]